jgi:hypothetical protein
MASNKPRKPTWPVGYVAFAKDGSVESFESSLPTNKEGQEDEVARMFARKLHSFHGFAVSDPERLPERDHDHAMTVSGKRVVLQIVEIAPLEFELQPGSIDPGDPECVARFKPTKKDGIQLDSNKLNTSIQRAIEKKLAKHYSVEAASATWLLIFTTSPFILPEFYRDEELVGGEPLRIARDFLRNHSCSPFAEIWFMNVSDMIRPVKVWPLDELTEP